MPNLQKWVHLSFLVCGVVVWLFLREILSLVLDAIGFTRADWFIGPPDVGGIFLGISTFVVLLRSTKANTYLIEVLAELAKVTWPNRKETILSTGVVSVMGGIAVLCVLFFDTVWAWVVETFLYR